MSSDSATVPRNSEELQAYARDRMRTIIDKYNSVGGGVFTDFQDGRTGLIYRCAGALCLLLLVNGFDGLSEEEGWAEIVKKEFSSVLAHTEKEGFDASPLKQTDLFSAKGQYHYLDSVSWVLSFALHLRLAQLNNKIDLGELGSLVPEITKTALLIIKDSTCENGGWGFTSKVSKPDLYYSYAVMESLADFGDYVLGESEEDLEISEDKDLVEFLGHDLVKAIQQKRRLTAKWLVRDYLADLGAKEIDPLLDKDVHKKPHILLYYSYFVIDMLVVGLPDEFFKEDAELLRDRDRIYRGIEHAIYLSRIHFDNARENKKWWGDFINSSLELSWENFETRELLGRMDPARTQVLEPGLVPLSLRCNALYAFYLAKGADKKMPALFEILHENRHRETGLWDVDGYSVMVTERAIEAIVDYNDYLKRFESSESKSDVELAVDALVNEAIGRYFESGKGRAISVSQISAPPATGAPPSRNTYEELTEALAMGEKYLRQGVDPKGFDREAFGRFQRGLGTFASVLLLHRLKQEVQDEQKQKHLPKSISHNSKELLKQLGHWLSRDTGTNLGEVLFYLLTKAATEQSNEQASKKGGV